jgi:NarL family two-component system response regulator YdfI
MLHITPWERRVLEQLATGVAMIEIAQHLGMKEPDVESRVHTLFARLGVTTRAEAVAAATRRGLLAA